MATVEELVIKANADTIAAQNGLNQLNKSLSNISDQKPKQESFLQSMQKNWALVAGGAFAAYQSLKVVFDFMKESVQAAAAQEKVWAELAGAMQKIGVYTEKAMQHNKDFASSMQLMAGVADDEINKVQTLFTRFGVSGEQLDALTKATIDFAAATGRDLKSAADMVSRSINDTGENVGRYKIGIDGAAGSTERMTSIAANLNKLFGGAASADMETFAGKLRRVQVAGDDLKETFGMAMMIALKPSMDQMLKFSTAKDTIDGVSMAGRGVVVVFEILRLIMNNITLVFRAFGTIGYAAFTLIKGAVDEVKKVIQPFADTARKAFDSIKNAIAPVVDNLKQVGAENLKNADSIIAKNPILSEALNVLKSGFIGLGQGTVEAYQNAGVALVNLFNETTVQLQVQKQQFQETAEEEVDALELITRSFTKNQKKMFEDQLTFAKSATSGITNVFSSMFSTLIESNMNWKKAAIFAAASMLESIGDMIGNFLAAEGAKHLAIAIAETITLNPHAGLEYAAAGGLAAAAGVVKGLAYGGAAAIRANNADAMADGGMITEPVRGVGASGRQYTFGENGNEMVSPQSNSYGGSTIIIQNMTVGSGATADDFLFQLAEATGSRLLGR